MGYVDDHLLPNEAVVYRARLHWIIFAWSLTTIVLGAGAAAALYLKLPAEQYWLAGAGLAAIGLVLAVGPALRYWSSDFAVTDKRVLAKFGLVRRHSLETLLSKIEAISVDQDVTGRMLGYGTVTVIGTGGTQETLPMIADPLEFRRRVQAQIVSLEERGRLGRATGRDDSPARVERECPYCAEPILAKAKVCKHCGRDVA
jgi:Bacterial PH domain